MFKFARTMLMEPNLRSEDVGGKLLSQITFFLLWCGKQC